MATVHVGKLCTDSGFSNVVALKQLHAQYATDREFRAMFLDEARIVTRIRHGNVARTLDVVEHDGELWLVMEYVHGPSLAQLLHDGAWMPVAIATSILGDVLEGLHAAHDARSEDGEPLRVVHRDVSPHNILVGEDGIARIVDFGVAHAANRLQRTVPGQIKGKPAYMAPEQARGDEVDRRVDVYAAAVVLWEALTGERLFSGASAAVAMLKHAEEMPSPPSAKRADVPAELDAVVLKGLAKQPGDRFATAREMSEALEAAVSRASRGEVTAWLEQHQRAFFVERNELLARVEHEPSRSEAPTVAALVHARRKWPIAAALAALGVAVAGVALSRRDTSSPHASTPVPRGTRATPIKLMAPDFANTTGDPLFDPALITTFREVVNDSSEVITSYRTRSLALARSLEPTGPIDDATWIRVGATIGAPAAALGSITRTGAGYRVAVRVVEPGSGATLLDRGVDVATGDAAVAATTELALAVRELFGDTATADEKRRAVDAFRTTTLVAAAAYGRASDANRSGSWDTALREANAAVAADPSFAMGQFALGLAFGNAGRYEDAERAYRSVFAHTDRVSEANRLMANGLYFTVRHEPAKAVEQLSHYVERYPTNFGGVMDLANAYFTARDMASAEREGRRAYELGGVPVALANVALYAAYAGDFADAVRAAREVIAGGGDVKETAFVALAHADLGLDLVDDARAVYADFAKLGATSASRAALGEADIALGDGRLHDAERIVVAAIDADTRANAADLARVKQAVLAETHLRMGRRDQALAEADRLATSEDLGVLVMVARLYAAARDDRRASAAAARLADRIEPDARAYAELVAGELALGSGHTRDALVHFEAAQKLADAWLVRFDLGRTYVALGQYAEAAHELEACAKRHGEALALFLDDAPTYRYWPELVYLQARALDGLGNAEATETYRRFSALKQHSEPDPIVADARRRARLP
jgi:serine/threonine-protein kinase